MQQPLLNIAVKAARTRRRNHRPQPSIAWKACRSQPRAATTSSPRSTRPPRREIISTIRRLVPGSRVPRRGKRPQRRERHGLDHRPARWHHQFPARLSHVRRVHRLPDPGPARAGGGLRSHAPGDLHRLARRGRAARRPPHPRQQAARARRRADRHGLSVSRKPAPTSMHISRCSRR